jgi:Ca-activated chloride channel homolog
MILAHPMPIVHLAWISVAALALPAHAQDGTVFSAGVSLVHVDGEVVGQNGRNLAGLSKEDFRVLDEGREQAIVSFSSDEQPLDVILLFDVSGSMIVQARGVASAARTGLNELRKGDRVAVMVFNTRSRVVAPFTEDLNAVERSISEGVLGQRFGGGTYIQQAADDAALLFLSQPRSNRRRAVLIITDNIGKRTRREQPIIRDYWEADAVLSGLILPWRSYRTVHTIVMIVGPQNLLGERLTLAGMKGIAEKTGGDAIDSADPGPAFEEMMHRLRTRYSLYYATPHGRPGVQRTLHLELSAAGAARFPQARVRARHGYITPAQ